MVVLQAVLIILVFHHLKHRHWTPKIAVIQNNENGYVRPGARRFVKSSGASVESAATILKVY